MKYKDLKMGTFNRVTGFDMTLLAAPVKGLWCATVHGPLKKQSSIFYMHMCVLCTNGIPQYKCSDTAKACKRKITHKYVKLFCFFNYISCLTNFTCY